LSANNEVWDACVEVLGHEPKTKTEKALWGRMIKSLSEAGATAESIRGAATAYRREWPKMSLTITSIEKWYSQMLRSRQAAIEIEKPFVCEYCGLRFKTDARRIEHEEHIHYT